MATLSSVIHEVVILSERLKGSYEHREHRRHLFAPFLRFCRDVGALRPRIADIPEWAVHAYAHYCVAQQMPPANLANVFSAIRVIFKKAGKDINKACSNCELGLPRRSRMGTRKAYTAAEFAALVERTMCTNRGLAHLIGLARWLGLRKKEALMCGRDLRMWRDAIAGGQKTVSCLRGAKNGRPREIEVLEKYRPEILAAIDSALEFCEPRNFELISGRDDNLASAMSRLTSLLWRAGLRGQLTVHAFRYTYAQDLAHQCQEDGVAPRDTLTRISNALGHGSGDNRAVMAKNVYCQPIRERFEGCFKRLKTEATGRAARKTVPRARARIENKLRHAVMSGHPIGRIDSRPARHAAPRGREVSKVTKSVNDHGIVATPSRDLTSLFTAPPKVDAV